MPSLLLTSSYQPDIDHTQQLGSTIGVYQAIMRGDVWMNKYLLLYHRTEKNMVSLVKNKPRRQIAGAEEEDSRNQQTELQQ